jgi:hypothetical protein
MERNTIMILAVIVLAVLYFTSDKKKSKWETEEGFDKSSSKIGPARYINNLSVSNEEKRGLCIRNPKCKWNKRTNKCVRRKGVVVKVIKTENFNNIIPKIKDKLITVPRNNMLPPNVNYGGR